MSQDSSRQIWNAEIAGLDTGHLTMSSPTLSSPAMSTPAKSSVNVQSCNFSQPRQIVSYGSIIIKLIG